MDGTFGGGDLISASLAIMLGGGDSVLHDKEVVLTTSQITGSQTAIFEYDPQYEDPQGTPPGPWDGYSLFTIDLSGVKDDIEGMQQQIADLEDELEEMQECCEDVAEILDAVPEQGETCCDAVKRRGQEVVDENEDLKEQVEECDQCKADVIAKLQEYDPDFDPVTCSDIPPEIDKVIEDAPEKYTFDPEVPIDDVSTIVAGEPIGTPNSDYYLDVYVYAYQWGVTPPKEYTGRTVYATAETGELSARIVVDIVDGNGDAVRHYTQSVGYSIFPSLNGYAQITNYTITNDVISVDMLLYRSDAGGSTRSASFTDALFADFASGPYTVKKKS